MLIKIKKSRPVLYGRYFLNFESTQPEETVVTPYNKTIRTVAFSGVFFEAPGDDDNAPIAGEDEIPDSDIMAIANGGSPSGGGRGGGKGSSEPEAKNVPSGGGDAIAGEDEVSDGDLMTIANGGTPGDGPVTSDADDFTGGSVPATDGPVTDGGDDFTAGADGEGGGDAPATDGPATEDNSQDFTDGADGDAGGADGPATDGGGEDFTSGAEDGGGSGGTGDGGEDSGGNNGEEDKPGVDYDSMRRYTLFNEYIELSNSVDGYISKLEGITKDDVEENRVILQAVSDLREIRDLLFDYIKMKFQTDTYFAARLFHQRMITAVQLVFRSIKTMQELRPKDKSRGVKKSY